MDTFSRERKVPLTPLWLVGNFFFQVPKGHVWLQGDNQFVSRDSREYGPVPAALVKGKVVFKVRKFETEKVDSLASLSVYPKANISKFSAYHQKPLTRPGLPG